MRRAAKVAPAPPPTSAVAVQPVPLVQVTSTLPAPSTGVASSVSMSPKATGLAATVHLAVTLALTPRPVPRDSAEAGVAKAIALARRPTASAVLVRIEYIAWLTPVVWSEKAFHCLVHAACTASVVKELLALFRQNLRDRRRPPRPQGGRYAFSSARGGGGRPPRGAKRAGG